MRSPDLSNNDSFLEWMAILTLSLLFIVMVFVYLPSSFTRKPKTDQPAQGTVVQTELPIGDFSVMQLPTAGQVGSQVIIFEAHARIDGNVEEVVRFDQYRVTHKARIAETVDTIIREATPADLQDLSLNHLKSRIKDRLNHVIGEQIIDEVLMSDYRSFSI